MNAKIIIDAILNIAKLWLIAKRDDVFAGVGGTVSNAAMARTDEGQTRD